ncbi:hypothetical protein HRR83_000080 [Exophiala dermatitidis]|uniref:INO80 complex subunit B-like conserved region domain-containing protein n=2 Tax=Exophiala dermatitidis TaxID=5970 RepID=H6C894_EXODN|nr:uncharacterized protein HMPREF1120_08287 [Exophiala dermatitidis NIH/UT8656]KAJ4523433.1 hypothetical protein HRR73_002614 [Exophiala dermatitidis]EHY60321.1 hypothetical protein HMPREF1120_08287 [Exophiala dermatitidis NIH/UT8656]KAJ4527329.1 hypothetical protein HRR74_000081 [Exophiala dermatitidis]KAJ4530885.1 hypothetical protein HRR76_008576 [Exophiala dermatitidis]KAJ4558058.1 hypothetical protein HRR77_000081 [Exophiala dermatitidis]
MTDRSRRVRRQISDATDDLSDNSESDTGSGEDYDPRIADSMRRAGRYESSSAASTPASSRPRRTGPPSGSTGSSATVQRGSGSTDDKRQSLKLTVKAAPSKLREVMRASEIESLQDTLGGGQVLDGPRSSRRSALASRASARGNQRPTYAEYGESDIEDDDEDDEVEEDENEDEDDDDDDGDDDTRNDFDELGAEPEGGTDDEDVEMEDSPAPPPKRQQAAPKAPKITLKPPAANADGKQSGKSKLVVQPADVGPVKSVEEQEMEDDPDDDEVDNSSELSDEEDQTMNNANDAELEGEEDEEIEVDARGEAEEVLDDDEDDDDDLDDSDDETPASGSATPDLSRLTKRQRGRPEDQGTLLALDMAPQQRKFFTDEEKAMKKDEHARKRKELTKRKIQEEKAAALNRLLKPQVSKARGAAPKPETLAAATAAATAASPYDEEEAVPKANPLYTRWVSTKDGVKLGVPDEWLGKRVGRMFGPPLPSDGNPLVQEVE